MKKDDPAKFAEVCSAMNLKGRARNNIRAIEFKDRDIVPARRMKDRERDHTYLLVWCFFCKKTVTKKGYGESHLKKCKQGNEMSITKTIHKQLTKSAVPVVEHEDITIERILSDMGQSFKEVLFDLRNDRLALTMFAKNDPVARGLVSRMASVGRGKNCWITAIRNRLRMLLAIFTYFKTNYNNDCNSVMELMHYSRWHRPETNDDGAEITALVKCCYYVCKKHPNKNTFEKYNDVMNFSSLLKQVSDIILNHIHHTDQMHAAWLFQGKSLSDYMFSDSWKFFTVRLAARQKALMHHFIAVMVPPEDFKYFLAHVEKRAEVAIAALMDAWERKDVVACITALATVIEVLPLAIGVYCYRRASEPYKYRTGNYENRPRLDELLIQYAHIVSTGADKEISKVFILESIGKGDNPVYSVIQVKFQPAFDLLCNPVFRAFVGIPEANDFIFASVRSRNGMGHAHPTKCQAKYAKECEGHVSDHKILRSRNFRKTFATNLCNMDLTYSTKKLMCTLMGHNMGVHEQYYNIPQPLQMAAYMGYACQASAEDKIRHQSAKTIEEIVDKQAPAMTTAKNGEDDMYVFSSFYCYLLACPISLLSYLIWLPLSRYFFSILFHHSCTSIFFLITVTFFITAIWQSSWKRWNTRACLTTTRRSTRRRRSAWHKLIVCSMDIFDNCFLIVNKTLFTGNAE